MFLIVKEPAVVAVEINRGVDEDETGDDEQGERDDWPAGKPTPETFQPEVDEDDRKHGDDIDNGDFFKTFARNKKVAQKFMLVLAT